MIITKSTASKYVCLCLLSCTGLLQKKNAHSVVDVSFSDLAFAVDKHGDTYATFALVDRARENSQNSSAILGDLDLGSLLMGTGGLQGSADASQSITQVNLWGLDLNMGAKDGLTRSQPNHRIGNPSGDVVLQELQEKALELQAQLDARDEVIRTYLLSEKSRQALDRYTITSSPTKGVSREGEEDKEEAKDKSMALSLLDLGARLGVAEAEAAKHKARAAAAEAEVGLLKRQVESAKRNQSSGNGASNTGVTNRALAQAVAATKRAEDEASTYAALCAELEDEKAAALWQVHRLAAQLNGHDLSNKEDDYDESARGQRPPSPSSPLSPDIDTGTVEALARDASAAPTKTTSEDANAAGDNDHGVEWSVDAAVAAAEAEFASLAAAEKALDKGYPTNAVVSLNGIETKSHRGGGDSKEPESPGIVARGEEALRAAEDACG